MYYYVDPKVPHFLASAAFVGLAELAGRRSQTAS